MNETKLPVYVHWDVCLDKLKNKGITRLYVGDTLNINRSTMYHYCRKGGEPPFMTGARIINFCMEHLNYSELYECGIITKPSS